MSLTTRKLRQITVLKIVRISKYCAYDSFFMAYTIKFKKLVIGTSGADAKNYFMQLSAMSIICRLIIEPIPFMFLTLFPPT